MGTLITDIIIKAIKEGLDERKREKEDEAEKEGAAAKAKLDEGTAAAEAMGLSYRVSRSETKKVFV